MTLNVLLSEKGIRRALIVDDVCDAEPTANDIDPTNEAWSIFNDDLLGEQRAKIEAAYPLARSRHFDELIADNAYVEVIWRLRGELGSVCDSLFSTYISDQASDRRYLDVAIRKLEALGLECKTSGRDFTEAAQNADLILIDLFFNKNQDGEALSESKSRLKDALSKRRNTPPIVILMSRSPRLEAKRDEFRDQVGLLDSAFRIIQKAELEEHGRLERQLERLAENAIDSRNLANFFYALEIGMEKATQRTLTLLRKLRLSDIGQIQQLLLSAEGEPTGSYLVDVFDRVLQHEIERESSIIDAALKLNGFSIANHPPPYIAGSPDLQDLVERTLTQNTERLRLPGTLEASVAFGDILKMTDSADVNRLKSVLLVDTGPNKVMLILTPACDLQRTGAPRIFLLIGTLKHLGLREWSYKGDARTPVIRIGDELYWIQWDLKHIDTVSHVQLGKVFENGDVKVIARLREAHALELQQKVLTGLGRVGMVATLPATFPVNVEVFYANGEGVPTRLDVPALSEGAVCFVGRDDETNQVLKLVMAEPSCDGIIDALSLLNINQIAPDAQKAFTHLHQTTDLRHTLTSGINLKGIGNEKWTYIKSVTGADNGIPNMGLIAWNYIFPVTTLHKKDLNKAGIIILVKDLESNDSPGLDAALRSGLVQLESENTCV